MTSFHLCFKGNREAEIKFEIERVYKNREKKPKENKAEASTSESTGCVCGYWRNFCPDG
jgi:hypothetical protein